MASNNGSRNPSNQAASLPAAYPKQPWQKIRSRSRRPPSAMANTSPKSVDRPPIEQGRQRPVTNSPKCIHARIRARLQRPRLADLHGSSIRPSRADRNMDRSPGPASSQAPSNPSMATCRSINHLASIDHPSGNKGTAVPDPGNDRTAAPH
ncbi:hypothetical protein ACLOJK_002336 [Asimina triloba]